MATSIGAVGCDDIVGRPPEIEEAVEANTVAGLDGVELETIGLRGGPFQLRVRKNDTHANIMTWIAQLVALSGDTSVIITLPDTSTYDKCYIGNGAGQAVTIVEKKPISVGGADKFECWVVVAGHRSAT